MHATVMKRKDFLSCKVNNSRIYISQRDKCISSPQAITGINKNSKQSPHFSRSKALLVTPTVPAPSSAMTHYDWSFENPTINEWQSNSERKRHVPWGKLLPSCIPCSSFYSALPSHLTTSHFFLFKAFLLPQFHQQSFQVSEPYWLSETSCSVQGPETCGVYKKKSKGIRGRTNTRFRHSKETKVFSKKSKRKETSPTFKNTLLECGQEHLITFSR